MKKKTILLSAISGIALVAVAVVLIVVLGGSKGDMPTKKQWNAVGVSKSFDAEVKGTLESSVVTDGEVSMKWTNSDEQSLDNTIDWLKGEGFISYNGASATKENVEGGKMISYTAEKIAGTTSSAGLFNVVAYADEGNVFVAETYYITEDFSLMSVNFKAGELYLDVYEKTDTQQSGAGLLTAWPTDKIQTALGVTIPAYAGVAEGYQFIDSSMGYMKNVTVNVFGAEETDEANYIASLITNGFEENDDLYIKTLDSGDVLQVMVFMSMTYNPDTFELEDIMSISAVLEKHSGSYTSWSSLNLSEFIDAGIPAYNGGTSYDIDEATTDLSGAIIEYEQIIEQLAPYESMLDAETREQLEKARQSLELISQVKAKVVTIYGTNEEEFSAYKTALGTAGFIEDKKTVGDYQFVIEYAEEDGRLMITFVKQPVELADLIEQENGSSKESTLPTNLKIVYSDGIYEVTAIKLGEDYLVEKSLAGFFEYIFYKKNGAGWEVYVKEMFESEWQLDEYQETDRTWIEKSVFDFIVEGIDRDAVKIGSDTFLGKDVDIYLLDYSSANYSYTDTYYVDAETGLVLKLEMITPYQTITYVVSLYDTSVTSFGEIDLPQ